MSSFTFSETRKLVLSETEMIFDLSFHPKNEQVVAVSTVEGDVLLLDYESEVSPVIVTLNRHHKGSSVRKVAFANDDLLVSGAKTIKIYDMVAGKTIRKIDNNGSKIYSLLVIDNYLLCTGDDEGWFKLWDYRANRGCSMELKECEDYISDLDANSEKRLVVASSGEGTLSAFNVRAKRLETPQSELFDAGFQSVRFLEKRNKVLVGAEDGALNIFNVNEWGNISDRYPIPTGASRGQAPSLDNIQVIGDSVILVGSSDGKLRMVNILPNRVLSTVTQHDSPIETLSIKPSINTVASSDSNVIKFFKYQQVSEEEAAAAPQTGFFSELS